MNHAPPPSPGSQPLTILVVDDEPGVRKVAARMLRSMGYAVIEAGDPRDALALAEVEANSVDVLITDLVMPGMDGRALARRLTARRPGLPVVYMSGYSPETIFRDGLLEEGTPFLAKPFQREDLAQRVRAALAG